MKSTVVYQATPTAKSRCYALRMGLRTLWHSLRYVWKANTRGHTLEEADQCIQDFAIDLLALSHTSLKVYFEQPISSDQPFMVMSNHRSLMDIPAILIAFPNSLRMVSKKELSFIPFFGRAMKEAGFIFIDRKNRTKAFKQLDDTKFLLTNHISIWMAPEGTRNRSKEPLLPFKKGGFHVAMALKIPILPAWIHDSEKVIPSGSLKVIPNQTIQVSFGKPIPTEGQTLENLIAQTKGAMLQLAETEPQPADDRKHPLDQ